MIKVKRLRPGLYEYSFEGRVWHIEDRADISLSQPLWYLTDETAPARDNFLGEYFTKRAAAAVIGKLVAA